MTKTPTGDVAATLAQIERVAAAGGELIRCAVPNVAAAQSLAAIIRKSPLPVVADVHFDSRIALAAIEAGAHKLRLNPGNMGADLAGVVRAAKDAGIPVRIGVNAGSLAHSPGADAEEVGHLLAETALRHAADFDAMGFRDTVVSVKSSDILTTVHACRLVAARSDYPLHLGLTEAGPEEDAMLKSAVALGGLLIDGIGDTLRLSFTGPPEREVLAGRDLLRASGLLRDRPELVSCPTCGRCRVDLQPLAQAVRQRLQVIRAPLRVAVMGCEVNGPGEARDADIGLAASAGRFTLFARGEALGDIAAEDALAALMREVERLAAQANGGEG